MATQSFSGIASGLDTQALIDAASSASRQSRVVPNQKRVTDLQGANTAFTDLKSKLDDLKSTLQSFTSINGGGINKTGTSSRESVVSATATTTASNATYAITVNALATSHTYSFDQTFASTNSPIQSTLTGSEPEADRTISFTVGTGGEAETVSVVATDGAFSAQDYVSAFNTASNTARASLVNIGTASSPSYKIVISSLYEGTEKGTISRTALGAGMTNLAAFSENAAADASVSITGIGTITRSSNSITDVIPGVTLGLSALGNATVKIAEDAPTTITKVQKFVDAYNDIVSFIADNNKITVEESGQDKAITFGPLSSSRIDDNALTAIRSAIAATVVESGSSVRVFADLGITTQRDGSLKLDTNKLQEAISTEVTSVSGIFQSFADGVALTGATIDQYTRFNGLIDITTQANQTTIDELNQRISDAEAMIQRQAEALKARYSRLESLMGKMQNQQQSLTSALSGLGK